MSLTISDAEDAFMQGRAGIEEWKAEFEAGWYAPVGQMMMMLLLARMTPEQLARARAQNPAMFDAVMAQALPGGGMNVT